MGALLFSTLLLSENSEAATSSIKSCSKKVTVTNEKAKLYKDSKLASYQGIEQGIVYEVDGYRTINNKNYYRVYQNKQYKGYLLDKDAKELIAKTMDVKQKYRLDSQKTLWSNFYMVGDKKRVTQKEEVFFRKYEYTLGNGKKYSSIYKKDKNNKDVWQGYVYSGSLKSFNAISYKATAISQNDSGVIYNDFYFNQKGKVKKGDEYTVQRYYELNNKRYYSAYKKDDWQGYINSSDLKVISPVKEETKKITVTKEDTELYTNSRLEQSKTANIGEVYDVDGYRIINDKKYYRVYRDQKYQGYIAENGVKDLKAISCDTSSKYYISKDQPLYSNLYQSKKKRDAKKDEIFIKKYEYTLGNGETYASIYKKEGTKDVWQGYVSSEALTQLQSTRLTSNVTAKNDAVVYKDFFFNQSTQSLEKGKEYSVQRFYIVQGKRYYSVYQTEQDGGKWQGYVSSDDLTFKINPQDKEEVKKAYAQGIDTGACQLTAKINKVDTVTEETIRGLDLTNYQAQKEAGVKYYDYDGNVLDDKEMMSFLKKNGVNYLNLKVAVNPQTKDGKTYGGGNPTLDNAIKTMKVAKEVGLKVNINLLFSDFYTSKGQQKLPKGWTNDNVANQSESYIKSVMKQLGTQADMITVGNYMNDDFLSQSTEKANKLLAQVTKIIKQESPQTKVALSYASPYKDWYWQICDRLIKADVQFDVMATDIYPAWDEIDNIKQAKESVTSLGKKFMINSVSYPFTDQDSDGHNNSSSATDIKDKKIGSLSPQGQASYMRKLYEAISQNNNSGGAGVFYNNAVWIAVEPGNIAGVKYNQEAAENYGTGWATKAAGEYVDGADKYAGASTVDNEALFDLNGHPLQSLSLFQQLLDGSEGVEDIIPDPDPFEVGGETGLKDQKAVVQPINHMSQNAIRGVDISSYQALKEAGVTFYDENGNKESLLKVLKDHGVNYIRLRLWNNPYADKTMDYKYKDQTFHIEKGDPYGAGNCDVSTMLKVAKEAKQYGMKVLIDFHYSDFWADPSQQILPKAWQGKSDKELQQLVYNYTKESLATFKEAGVDIGMVQVGNEITYGMMGIAADRDIGEDWRSVWKNDEKSKRINQYLKSGIKAVKEEVPSALVALHLETPNADKYQTIMDTWKRDGVDYDVLGSSYYPFWSRNDNPRPNSPQELNKVQTLAKEYGKYFAVLETSWVNTLQDVDGTPNSIGENHDVSDFGQGAQAQVDALSVVYDNVMKYNNGLGAFYWEPAWLAVKPGWKYWQENNEASDRLGTGWAGQGALGYFTDKKMFYNDKKAWGGSSWDNQALFDPQGHPLQSLNFYKDSISDNDEYTTVRIEYKDGDKQIQSSQFVRVKKGETVSLSTDIPKGYICINPNDAKLTPKQDAQTVTLQCVQAETINQHVSIIDDSYRIWQDLSFEQTVTDSNITYLAKQKIVYDQSTYYALYNDDDHFVGYINQKALKEAKGSQGVAFNDNRLVTLTDDKYKVVKNFNFEEQAIQGTGRIFQVKYQYHHMNGHIYYSLYNMEDEWQGYIDSQGCGTAEISSLTPINKEVTVIENTKLYNNSHLETSQTVTAKTVLAAQGERVINGKQYYKVYRDGIYQGYILASEVK